VCSAVLTVQSARKVVLGNCEKIPQALLPIDRVPIFDSYCRVLAESVVLDRDQPPFARAMRDGFALQAGSVEEVPATLQCIGEVKAGEVSKLTVQPGQVVQIMTGAAVPAGADAVVMVEHTSRLTEAAVSVLRAVRTGENVAPCGSERKAGEMVLTPGRRIAAFDMAVLATVGKVEIAVYRRPVVSILATGDELVRVEEVPGPAQIRNSNSFSLYAQARGCGAVPRVLETAGDNLSELKRQIQVGLESEVLLVSGGVSMGKYDLVEQAFQEAGVEIHFDAVSMRPGKPTVFASRGPHWVFGLPGNPLSTFVAFELFVKPVLQALQGMPAETMPLIEATLHADVAEKSGRSAFLPARVISRPGGLEITPVRWKGSADIFGSAEANALLVVPQEVARVSRGERVQALLVGCIEYDSEPRF